MGSPDDTRPATFAEVFPADEITAQFVLSMAMAADDLERALRDAGAANARATADQPNDLRYRVRLLAGHLVEALAALAEYAKNPDVRRLMQRVPVEGKRRLRSARRGQQQAGKGTLKAIRNHTFHYPAPGGEYNADATLRDVMTKMGGGVTLTLDGDTRRLYRGFADDAALALTLNHHDGDEESITRTLRIIRDAAAGFINWQGALFDTYCKVSGVTLSLVGHKSTVPDAGTDQR